MSQDALAFVSVCKCLRLEKKLVAMKQVSHTCIRIYDFVTVNILEMNRYR